MLSNSIPIPQLVQFANKLIFALGPGVAPQYLNDVSQVVVSAITAASETNNVATFTTSPNHGLVVGQQVVIAGVGVAGYNGVWTVLTQNGTNQFTAILPVTGLGNSSGGTCTPTLQPITNSFVAAYPAYQNSTSYAAGDQIGVTVGGTPYIFQAIQGGTSATAGTPAFSATMGSIINDNQVIWKNIGTASIKAPPGAATAFVYAGSLWLGNTSPFNTTDGQSGPSALQMSDLNNPLSWNPINVAFIGRDDGSDIMTLATFTVAEAGITPTATLIVFKDYTSYQITGVFGASDFAIQQVQTDMGCISPRTAEFVPGFGIIRMTHLGIAVFDGVRDRLLSEEIRPYLFVDPAVTDPAITAMDISEVLLAYGVQTVNPPMYSLAIPVGASGGALTRILCYDLIMKAWAIVDLPFSISCMCQVRTPGTIPITLFGNFQDGVIERWQAGDAQWRSNDSSASNVVWSMHGAEVFGRSTDERIFFRRCILYATNLGSTVLMQADLQGFDNEVISPITYNLGSSEQQMSLDIGRIALNASVVLSGQGVIEIDSLVWHTVPKPIGVLVKGM